ncbi:hypothetical protein MRB53_007726 [Persea americana]|uniref:Uncharacterized protein n=1 Tax=Persea americana TaxID=3435 RepID=A0ACC2MKG9_PERAE|nr:hypothetical protein MRB53_007726 [Persea americana]
MDVPNGSCQREEKSKRKHDAVFSQHPQSVKANKLVSTDGGTQLMEIDSERISPSKEGIPSVLKGSLQKHICFLCAAKSSKSDGSNQQPEEDETSVGTGNDGFKGKKGQTFDGDFKGDGGFKGDKGQVSAEVKHGNLISEVEGSKHECSGSMDVLMEATEEASQVAKLGKILGVYVEEDEVEIMQKLILMEASEARPRVQEEGEGLPGPASDGGAEMEVLRGAARGGPEDGGETGREKKSEEAALREQRRKMGPLHLVVVRWW